MMSVGIPKSNGSKTVEEVLQEVLKNTDWDAFWDTVLENGADEIKAYRVASAKSVGICHTFI